jgi:YHS domain-containing protein
MTVDRGRAVTRVLDGHTYYFCSEHCAHAFTPGSESVHAEAAHVH